MLICNIYIIHAADGLNICICMYMQVLMQYMSVCLGV